MFEIESSKLAAQKGSDAKQDVRLVLQRVLIDGPETMPEAAIAEFLDQSLVASIPYGQGCRLSHGVF